MEKFGLDIFDVVLQWKIFFKETLFKDSSFKGSFVQSFESKKMEILRNRILRYFFRF